MFEEAKEQMAPEIRTRIRAEIERTEFSTRGTQPVSMPPGSHDQQVRRARVCICDGVIAAERARKIFGIKPPADIQHRAVNVVKVLRDVALLPILVQRVMSNVFIQQRIPDECCNWLEGRPVREKEPIAVRGSIVVETADLWRKELHAGPARFEVVGVHLKLLCEHEDAVMVCVVSEEEIRHRS